MARQKLTEQGAKRIVYDVLDVPYHGLSYVWDGKPKNVLRKIDTNKSYVVKVDQGIKGRMKKGLIYTNVSAENVQSSIEKLHDKGYSHFYIEPYVEHDIEDEMYAAIVLKRDGWHVLVSEHGGIDIEKNADNIETCIVKLGASEKEVADTLEQSPLSETLATMIRACEKYHISFVEMNPIVNNIPLDCAIEVDSAGEYFAQGMWTSKDFAMKPNQTKEEYIVEKLNENSPSSFKLTVIDPDASTFMLLSGGGGSLVLADEYYNRGHGHDIANYGEYSGGPSEDETYTYAQQVLSLLLKSSAMDKKLVIAGGIANFTDVNKTFRGVVRALHDVRSDLNSQKIRIFIRRGGPNEKKGLSNMAQFLDEADIPYHMGGSDMPLHDIVSHSLEKIT